MARYTNLGLVSYVTWMNEKNCPYWFATYGQIASKQLLEQMLSSSYRSQYTKWPMSSFESQFGQKVADCSGEIKAYLMNPTVGDDGYASNPAVASVYNAKFDLSANMLESQAKEKGSISTIPEIKGLIVWKENHCGVYIGGGYVIEERGHSYGTVKTKLSDRPWVKWLKHPYIEYIDEPKPTPVPDVIVSDDMPVLKYDKANKKATKCDEVTLFQICMNHLNIRDMDGRKLEVDGSYGSRSAYCCEVFQRQNGLPLDGICGAKTWKVIFHKRYT